MKNFADILVQEDKSRKNYADVLYAEDNIGNFQKTIRGLNGSTDVNAYKSALNELSRYKGFIDDKAYNQLSDYLSSSIKQISDIQAFEKKKKEAANSFKTSVDNALMSDSVTAKDLLELQQAQQNGTGLADNETIDKVKKHLLGQSTGDYKTDNMVFLKTLRDTAEESGNQKDVEVYDKAIELKQLEIDKGNAKQLSKYLETPLFERQLKEFDNAFTENKTGVTNFKYSASDEFKKDFGEVVVPYFKMQEIRSKIKNGDTLTETELKWALSGYCDNSYFDSETILTKDDYYNMHKNHQKIFNENKSLQFSFDNYITTINDTKAYGNNSLIIAEAYAKSESAGLELKALAADDFDKYANLGSNDEATEFMTATQKGVYNYYLSKGDTQSAYAYKRGIQEDINYKEAKELAENEGFFTKTGISYAAGLEKFGEGLIGFVEMMSDNGIGIKTPQSHELKIALATDSVLSLATAEIIAGSGTWGKVWYSSMQSLGQQTPMIALSLANPAMGLSGSAMQLLQGSMMFVSSSGASYIDALKENKAENEAAVYAAINGALEVGLEKALGSMYGWSGGSKVATKLLGEMQDALMSKGLSKVTMALLGVVTYKLSGMASEGFEEYLQEVIDPIVRNFVYNEDNDISLFSEEAFISFASGALVSFLFGATNIKSTYRQSLAGASIRSNTDGINGLVENAHNALNNPEISVEIKQEISALLETIESKGNQATNIELGQLQELVQTGINQASAKQVEQAFNDLKNDIADAKEMIQNAPDLSETASIDEELQSNLINGTDTTTPGEVSNSDIETKAPNNSTDVSETDSADVDFDTNIDADINTEVNVESSNDVDATAESKIAEADYLDNETLESVEENEYDKTIRLMDGREKPLTEAQAYVQSVGRALGYNVVIDDLSRGGRTASGKSFKATTRGFFDGQTIYLHEGHTTFEAIVEIFKHEITHYAELNPKMYEKYADAVFNSKVFENWISEQKVDGEKVKGRSHPVRLGQYRESIIKEYAKHGVSLESKNDKSKNKSDGRSPSDCEIIANFTSEMLFNEKGNTLERFINEVNSEDRNAISQFIHDFISWLKARLKGEKVSLKIVKLENRFAAVLRNVDNKNAQKNNTTNDGDVQYDSEGNSYSFGDIERYAEYDKPITPDDIRLLRKIGRKSINEFTPQEIEIAQKWAYKFYQQLGTKSPFFRRWFGDWRAHDKTPVVIVDVPSVEFNSKEFNDFVLSQRGNVVNNDTKTTDKAGWTIRISGEGPRNTVSHSGGKRLSAKGLVAIQNLIENAVLLDSEVHEHHSNNSKSENTDRITFDHRLYSLGKNSDGSIALYRITVEEIFKNQKQPDDMRFHNLKYIEKVADNIGSLTTDKQHAESASDVSTTNYSVCDLYGFVKEFDADFTAGETVSRSQLNEDGTPKVFYHGTNAQFTEFDKKKSKPGFYGRGFYFTTEKSQANVYGNEMPVYLNIKNPLMPGKTHITETQIANFLDAVAENEDYSIENYGTYNVSEIMRSIESRDAFDVIQDINATAIGDFGEAMQLFNEVNGTSFDGVITSTETVVYESNQIKSAADGGNIGTFSEAENDIQYSFEITPEQDTEYLDAVNRGDMEAAQRMVDEAAKEAGYTVKGLHATNAEFTVFDIDKTSENNFHGKGIYFTNSVRDVENNYENYEGPDPWQKIEGRAYELAYDKYGISYEDTLTSDSEIIDKLNECYDIAIEEFNKSGRRITAYLRFDNPLILEKGMQIPNDYSGYDGIIDKQVYENIGHSGMDENTIHYVVFNPNNIKSADPITYDDNGNVIPLSERFNENDNDIRYSFEDDVVDKTSNLAERVRLGEISQTEYLNELQRLMNEATEKYGAIPKGENPKVDVTVPKQVSDKRNTRRFVRTVLESGILTDEMVADTDEAILKDALSYVPISNEEAIKVASKSLKNGTAERDWNKIANGDKIPSKHDIAKGEMLLKMYAENGDTLKVMELVADLSEVATRAGQTVQAFSLLKKMSGVGQLYYIQKTVDKLNRDLEKKHKGKHEQITIDETLAGQLVTAKPGTETENIVDEIMQDIAEQVPVTFLDKWNAWRYLAMLGNPRTHIRNLLGNAVFMPAIKLKDTIKTGMEKAFVSQENRTTSVIVNKEYKDFAKSDFEKVVDIITGNGKMNPSDTIREKQKIFKNKVLEGFRKFNFDALEKEDMIFLKMHYTRALGGFLQARNVDLNNVDEVTLNEARNYAIEEAQKATYRDMSALANTVSRFSRSNKTANLLIEGILPFKKTPINIVKRGIEYSPVGLLKTLSKGSYDLAKGNITASQFIDGISSGLTGTGVFVLGVILSNLGIAIGGLGYDDEDALKRLNGEQGYSIELFGKSYTVDWMAPVCIPFFMGVEFANTFADNEKDIVTAFVDAAYSSLEPVINLSMLSGIRDTIAAARYSDAEDVLTQVGGETISSYFSQALPTLFGQVARTLDDTRRSNYVSGDSTGFEKKLYEFFQNAIGKTPFLENQKMPYTDAFGEKDTNDNFFFRLFENMLSPGYSSTVKETDVNAELADLFGQTGDSAVIPQKAPKSFNVNGERIYLDADQYTQYNTKKGQLSQNMLVDLFNSKGYKSMTYTKKAEAVSEVYKYANMLAKTEVSDYQLEGKYAKWQEYQGYGYDVSELIALDIADKDLDGSGGVSKSEYAEAVNNTDMSQKQKDLLIGLNDVSGKSDYSKSKTKGFGAGDWYYKKNGQYIKITSAAELNQLRRNNVDTYVYTGNYTDEIDELWKAYRGY